MRSGAIPTRRCRVEPMSAGRVASGNQTERQGRAFALPPLRPYRREAAGRLRPSSSMGWDEPALRRRRLVEVHEAGHACAILLAGGEARVRLIIQRCHDGLFNFMGETSGRYPRRIDADLAFVALAGIGAEERYCREMGWERPSADDVAFAGDNANVARALALAAPRENAEALGDVISARVRDELSAAWPAVLALAGALDAYWPDAEADDGPAVGEFAGEMSAEEVAAICRDAGLGPK